MNLPRVGPNDAHRNVISVSAAAEKVVRICVAGKRFADSIGQTHSSQTSGALFQLQPDEKERVSEEAATGYRFAVATLSDAAGSDGDGDKTNQHLEQ